MPIDQPEVTVECSICGLVGGPRQGCNTCHGNRTFTAKRQFTRSDEIAGRAPDQSSRYGLDGDVGPRTSDPLWVGTERH